MTLLPTNQQAPVATAGTGLLRELGLWDAVSLIMGIMIGSGVFLMAGSIAMELDSLAAVVGVWAFGGLLSLCGAVALSELERTEAESAKLRANLERLKELDMEQERR